MWVYLISILILQQNTTSTNNGTWSVTCSSDIIFTITIAYSKTSEFGKYDALSTGASRFVSIRFDTVWDSRYCFIISHLSPIIDMHTSSRLYLCIQPYRNSGNRLDWYFQHATCMYPYGCILVIVMTLYALNIKYNIHLTYILDSRICQSNLSLLYHRCSYTMTSMVYM